MRLLSFLAKINIPTSDPHSLTAIVLENLSITLFFAFISLAITWVAKMKGFFDLPSKNHFGPDVHLGDVFYSFAIFLALFIFVVPLLWEILLTSRFLATDQPLLLSILQVLVFLITTLFLGIYNLFQDPARVLRIWKDNTFPSKLTLYFDLKFALITLLVAIPVVITISQIAEIITTSIFGYSEEEQVAVKYLKLAMSSNASMVLALFSILIAAPFLEEFLFRGILQSALRKKLGPFRAIILTSIAFAFFHFSSSQATTNIPLIAALFTFACYLGFLYEKTRSLFASIFLHMTFNSLSVIRLIFGE